MPKLSSKSAIAVLLVLVFGFGMFACGDDDDAATTTTKQAEGGEVGAGVGYGSECEPVGEDLEDEATETVKIQLADYAYVPAEIDVSAGVVTFEASNIGDEVHEIAFLPGGGEVPFTDGEPDEDALGEAGAFELEGFPAGGDCNATYDLEPGEYTLFCLIRSDDGKTHYEKGMAGKLTVS